MIKKHQQLFFSICCAIFLSIPEMCCNVYAQPTVVIEVDSRIPNNEIALGTGLKEIYLIVHTEEHILSLEWHLEGSGKFKGNTTHPGIFYVPPKTIEGQSSQVIITITFTDNNGNTGTESVTFTLKKPEPTATPQPTATSPPRPTETPTQQPTATPTFTSVPTPPFEESCPYTVKRGDSLIAIAVRYTGRSGNYIRIKQVNGLIKNDIKIGGRLLIPKALLLEDFQSCVFPIPTPAPIPPPTVTPTSRLTPTPTPPSGIRITRIVVTRRGKVIEPVQDIYTVKRNEVVTITVTFSNPDNHDIWVNWYVPRGKISDIENKTNMYNATNMYAAPKKGGGDALEIRITDEKTGDYQDRTLNINVVE